MSADPRPASRAPRLLRRRAALAGVAGVAGLVAVSACDDGDRPGPGPTPAPDPDTELVDRVLRELAKAERRALAAGAPAFARLHAAHIAALDGEPTTPGTRHTSADALRRHEQRLQHHLVNAAATAESGALARLLASMSAAVSQQLAVGAS